MPTISVPKKKLRDLPSPHYFWKDSHDEFFQLIKPGVWDKNFDGTNERRLTPNEVMTLALNEVAATKRKGFFWHLQSRNSGNKEVVEPESRKSKPPRAEYPALVYASFSWSEQGRANFLRSTHQFRLAASDFHLNSPHPTGVPISCFQVASDKQYPVYTTTHDSHVILLNQAALYFLPLTDFERIIGRWPTSKGYSPQGPEPEKRLDTIPQLWADSDRDPRCALLEPYKYSNVEAMYHDILWACDQSTRPSLTTAQIRQTFPRPVSPEMAIPLGTPLTATRPSKRGMRIDRSSGGSGIKTKEPIGNGDRRVGEEYAN